MIKRLVSTIAFLALLAAPSWAVTVVNCQLCTPVSTTNVTCPKPTGLVVGQLLFAFPISTQQTIGGGGSAPSGWTNTQSGSNSICGQSISNGPAFIYGYYKQATSADVAASSFLWQWPAGFGSGGGICAFDYVTYVGGNPIDLGGASNITCNSNLFSPSTTIQWNSNTTNSNNDFMLLAGCSSIQNGASAFTGPAGTTQLLTSSTGTYDNFWAGDFLMPTAGSTGNKIGSQAQSNQYNAVMVPLLSGPQAGSGNGLIWAFP